MSSFSNKKSSADNGGV